jgi:hypothetical protein
MSVIYSACPFGQSAADTRHQTLDTSLFMLQRLENNILRIHLATLWAQRHFAICMRLSHFCMCMILLQNYVGSNHENANFYKAWQSKYVHGKWEYQTFSSVTHTTVQVKKVPLQEMLSTRHIACKLHGLIKVLCARISEARGTSLWRLQNNKKWVNSSLRFDPIYFGEE